MPVFHTRTIESILAPVAQQVSRLVIIHEEAGDTNAMPDLSVPVNAVSKAVTNLVKVGKETINSSDDIILRQDMPVSLRRVESASKALEEASTLFKDDPFSQIGRVRLIEGARGILGGTSSLLLVFDQSEVRKIIAQCKKFLSYLDVTEVIESMDDLVQFVKDVTPCLTRVTRDVDSRQRELTHTLHREIIVRCLDSVKTLAPILICSMKIFIQLKTETKITNEAIENRNYLGSRMTDEINEIIRVLQLTSADEDEWDLDYLNCMRRALATILAKMQAAHDFLENSSDVIGGIGEKSLRHILDLALKISDYCHPAARAAIRKQVGDLRALIDALCELRSQNKGTSPQAQSMARSISGQLKNLVQLIEQAIRDMERDGLQIPRQTLEGRLEQALRWLANPGFNDRGLGSAAIRAIIEEARRLAASCPPATASDLRRAAAEVEALARQLEDLVNRGLGNSPAALALARQLGQKLKDLKKLIDRALIDRVVNDFLDIHTPLKQFTEAVLAPVGTPNREGNFVDKAANLKNFSNAAVRTARDVASGSAPNKRIAENLNNAATNVESLCPQLINAGRIRLDHPDNRNADEHFNNLRNQYADGLQRMRNLVDEAIDANDFIQALEDAIRRHTAQCENAIATGDPQKMVDNASAIARLANRICNVAKQEADNSEDPAFINRINRALNNLQNTISPMVADAKDVALNIHDPNAANKWRASNNKLIDAVGGVKNALAPQVPDLNRLNLDDLEPRATSYQQATIHPPAISHPPANAVPQPAKYHPIQLMSTDYELPKPRSPIHSNRYITKMNAAPAVPYQVSHLIHSPTRANAAIPPPRPIPPVTVSPAIPRPPPPQETDDEDERFPSPSPNQPIMMAAHGLHQEIKDWSSKDNEIIAAAKRMALLMARLSQLVRGEGSKKDLISCAKAIEEASKHIANLAKEQAKLCTDKRMRTTILQVCERIPTMGTQLSILCTVKATMLGCQASEEDREATEMLEGNAKFIMDSVKETVKACESASIKIRSDAGVRMVWQRKPNWHQRI